MLRRSFVLLPVALAACAATTHGDGKAGKSKEKAAEPASEPTRTSTPSGAQRFKGTFDFHFETSSFMSEDGQGPYWLSGEGDVWPQLTAPFRSTGRPWGELAVEIEGELSAPGRYGHMGAYTRELRVTRVLSTTLIRSR